MGTETLIERPIQTQETRVVEEDPTLLETIQQDTPQPPVWAEQASDLSDQEPSLLSRTRTRIRDAFDSTRETLSNAANRASRTVAVGSAVGVAALAGFAGLATSSASARGKAYPSSTSAPKVYGKTTSAGGEVDNAGGERYQLWLPKTAELCIKSAMESPVQVDGPKISNTRSGVTVKFRGALQRIYGQRSEGCTQETYGIRETYWQLNAVNIKTGKGRRISEIAALPTSNDSVTMGYTGRYAKLGRWAEVPPLRSERPLTCNEELSIVTQEKFTPRDADSNELDPRWSKPKGTYGDDALKFTLKNTVRSDCTTSAKSRAKK